MSRPSSSTKKGLKVVVITGSVRPQRMSERMGKFVMDALKDRGHSATLLDPAEKKLPMLETPFHHYPDPKQAPKVLQDMNAVIQDADAFVVITAEYNRSVPPALSNLLDHFSPKAYAYRPAAIISYSPGPGAGVSACSQLRMMLGELGTLQLPMMFHVAMVDKKVDANGKATDPTATSGLAMLLDQLELVGNAMKNQFTVIGGLAKAPKIQPYL